ncbi:hypothetical protein M758_4G158800 [Ceratodon purpureus]|nr:hypothetical protein M758_4G158800 [Ceratodon purpureus]
MKLSSLYHRILNARCENESLHKVTNLRSLSKPNSPHLEHISLSLPPNTPSQKLRRKLLAKFQTSAKNCAKFQTKGCLVRRHHSTTDQYNIKTQLQDGVTLICQSVPCTSTLVDSFYGYEGWCGM